MALYGRRKDINLFKGINRELLGNIINQQVAFYKVNLEKTTSNLYGEAVDKRFFSEPTLFNCLIERNDPNFEETDLGRDYNRTNTFHFLTDDLKDAGVYPELGDVIFYYGNYYEVEQSIDNQLFVGKDPNYNYASNPLNTGLEEFGWDVSISCTAHYVAADKLGLSRER